MFKCIQNTSLHPSFQELYTFREGSLAKKKNGRIKELFFTNVWRDFGEQTIAYTKKRP